MRGAASKPGNPPSSRASPPLSLPPAASRTWRQIRHGPSQSSQSSCGVRQTDRQAPLAPGENRRGGCGCPRRAGAGRGCRARLSRFISLASASLCVCIGRCRGSPLGSRARADPIPHISVCIFRVLLSMAFVGFSEGSGIIATGLSDPGGCTLLDPLCSLPMTDP